MQSLLILGRQPNLSVAELESLYGSTQVQLVGTQTALVEVDPCLLAFDRLGGSTKFCKLLTTLETTKWSEIESFLIEVSPGQSQAMPAGKMQLGLSLYDFGESKQRITATGLSLKKAIQKTGRSVRLVPNQTSELSSAQVIHNRLTGPLGWELIFVRDNVSHRTLIGQTVKVQDIAWYTRRDRERPKRDAKVGMLPPKLAQMILNLAVGPLPESSLQSICDIPADQEVPRPRLEQTALDPFCGTGVILQEAALMGYETYGSDIDERMIDFSRQNLAWLCQTHRLAPCCCRLEVGDATTKKWHSPIDFVATETYLGRPFTATPKPQILTQTVASCNAIIRKFLLNLAPQLNSGTRLCIAVPAWQTKQNQFEHLPLVDQIGDLGYNRVSFEHVRDDQLLYYRADQFVARELIVMTRK